MAFPGMVTAVWFVITPYWLRPGHSGQGWKQNLVLWLANYCRIPETSVVLEVVKIYLRGGSSIKLQEPGHSFKFTCNSRRHRDLTGLHLQPHRQIQSTTSGVRCLLYSSFPVASHCSLCILVCCCCNGDNPSLF